MSSIITWAIALNPMTMPNVVARPEKPIDIEQRVESYYEKRKARLATLSEKNRIAINKAIADNKPIYVIDAMKKFEKELQFLMEQNERMKDKK
jgi:hypothetical protein